jgi:hypothetical protein
MQHAKPFVYGPSGDDAKLTLPETRSPAQDGLRTSLANLDRLNSTGFPARICARKVTVKLCATVTVGFGAFVSSVAIGFLVASVSIAQSPDAAALNPDEVDTPPALLSPLSPGPQSPGQAQVGGELVLSAVVGIDGLPTDITVIKSVSPNQDKRFVEALEKSRFEPGKLDHKPVPVRVTFRIKFRPTAGWPEFSFGSKPQTANPGLVLFDFSTGGQRKSSATN